MIQRTPFCRVGPMLAATLLFCACFSRAQQAAPEYQFKAAYLYHFTQFTDWPAQAFSNPTSPFVVAVLGENPFGDELAQAFRGKAINGHPATIRPMHSAAEAATNCHLLFISASEKKALPEILSALRDSSVLTVGDTDTFTEAGGMIKFVWLDKKLQFQINIEAAKNAGLIIRAKLLNLALKPNP